MALKIRLRQQGRTNRQTYRLVVTDIRNPRDGKYLEMIGWYNPFSTTQESQVDIERINYWVGQGAEITPSAQIITTPATAAGNRLDRCFAIMSPASQVIIMNIPVSGI